MEKLSFLYLLQLIYIGAKFNYRFARVYGFHIHKQMYYRIGTLLPDFETQFQFAQMYIYNTTNHELQNRLNMLPNFNYLNLQQILHAINPYIVVFCQVGALLRANSLLDLKLEQKNKRFLTL